MKLRKGFTLIELMIVVAIVAILAAIALPAYQKQVRDSRRADATAVLVQARQMMERYYSKHYSYKNSDSDIPSKSPIDGRAVYYRITLLTSSDTAYTIVARPKGDQLNDLCGPLFINQAGKKHARDGSVDQCW